MGMTIFGSIKAGDQFLYDGVSYVKIEEQFYTVTLLSGAKRNIFLNAVNLTTRQSCRFYDSEEIAIFGRIEDFCVTKSKYTYPEEPREIDVIAEPEVKEAFDQFINRYTKEITRRHLDGKLGCSPTELLTMAILRRLA